MLNFNVQLNNTNETKTLNEIIEETFAVKKPMIDVSFFYKEKNDYQKNKEEIDTEVKIPNTER